MEELLELGDYRKALETVLRNSAKGYDNFRQDLRIFQGRFSRASLKCIYSLREDFCVKASRLSGKSSEKFGKYVREVRKTFEEREEHRRI